MISTLALAHRDKARLWLGELPRELHFEPTSTLDREVDAGSSPASWPSVALEVLLPRGPMAFYGALGVSFAPLPSGKLQLSVGSRDEGRAISDGLAGRIDEVRCGLPAELSSRVVDGISQGVHLVGLGPGSMSVVHAAAGAVGSNAWVFERLGRAVAVLLAAGPSTDWQRTISELFE